MKSILLSTLIFWSAPSPLVAAAQERVPIAPSPEPPHAEEPLPPGLSDVLFAEWKLRDLEGRWVLWQRLVEDANDELLQAWRLWLANRGEFDLLERDALDDTGWSSASDLLQRHDAPQWLRVAHWQTNATDSHTWDAAKAALESRPALTLSWIEAHPSLLEDPSTKKLYEGLAKGVSDRDECAAYSAPYDLAEVFAPLQNLGWVAFGDRLIAVDGERYVHQALHAMQALVGHKRRTPEWERRLFDLAFAKNLEVRVAALQAATRLDSGSLPWPEFRALFDSRGEPDVVRGAAWIALTYAPRVIVRRNYLEVLPGVEEAEYSEGLWMLFAERLPEVGGWVEAELMKQIFVQDEALRSTMTLTRDRLRRAWDKRLSADTLPTLQAEVELLAYLRTQDQGLRDELNFTLKQRRFSEWISAVGSRATALRHLASGCVVAEGVFPSGERISVDGAGRDLEAWARLVAQEAELLLGE